MVIKRGIFFFHTLVFHTLFDATFGFNLSYNKVQFIDVIPYVDATRHFVSDDTLRNAISDFKFTSGLIENRSEFTCAILCAIYAECWITAPGDTGCMILGYGSLPGSSDLFFIEPHQLVYMKTNGLYIFI